MMEQHMTKINDLKQLIQNKLAAAKAEAEMKLLSNEKFQDVLVSQMMREETTTKLQELVAMCSTIVSDNKVYSKTNRQERTWKPVKVYGFGNQFTILSELLNGVQYSVQEHTDLMLAATGLSKDLVERTLLAVGNTSYYSTTYSTIVQGTAANVPELLECVELLEYTLGVSIDKSLITQAVADRLEDIAYVKAEKAEAEATLAATVQQYIIK